MRVLFLIALLGGGSQAQTFEARKLAMIDAYAHFAGPGDQGYGEIAARLWKHENPAWG